MIYMMFKNEHRTQKSAKKEGGFMQSVSSASGLLPSVYASTVGTLQTYGLGKEIKGSSSGKINSLANDQILWPKIRALAPLGMD